MSVLYGEDVDANAWWIDAAMPPNCEGCGEPIQYPAVYWHAVRTLFWCPACAAHLGPHLIADAREATLAAAPEPHWRRRLIGSVRHRLVVEELVA